MGCLKIFYVKGKKPQEAGAYSALSIENRVKLIMKVSLYQGYALYSIYIHTMYGLIR